MPTTKISYEVLERARNGFGRLDAGEIDGFELDDLIHHYKASGNTVGGDAARPGDRD